MSLRTFIFGLAASFGVAWLFIIVVPFIKMRNLEPIQLNEATDGTTGIFYPKRTGRITNGALVYAEYGCYLFDHACKPLLADFMKKVDTNIIGKNFNTGKNASVDNFELVKINAEIRNHSVEICGAELRAAMTAMKKIVE